MRLRVFLGGFVLVLIGLVLLAGWQVLSRSDVPWHGPASNILMVGGATFIFLGLVTWVRWRNL